MDLKEEVKLKKIGDFYSLTVKTCEFCVNILKDPPGVLCHPTMFIYLSKVRNPYSSMQTPKRELLKSLKDLVRRYEEIQNQEVPHEVIIITKRKIENLTLNFPLSSDFFRNFNYKPQAIDLNVDKSTRSLLKAFRV